MPPGQRCKSDQPNDTRRLVIIVRYVALKQKKQLEEEAAGEKPSDPVTKDDENAAREALDRLIQQGERFLRYWQRKMVQSGMDDGEAVSWCYEYLYKVVVGFNPKNPYFWAHAENCFNRKRQNWLTRHRRQQDREVPLSTIEDVEDEQHVGGAQHETSEHIHMLAKQIQDAANESLSPGDRELLLWVMEGGSYKDYAAMHSTDPKSVSARCADIKRRIRERIGDIHGADTL
jgi:RNA polymerase sigma factor (sigma-70 family)